MTMNDLEWPLVFFPVVISQLVLGKLSELKHLEH